MKPTKTEQLRKLLAEASPGPWTRDDECFIFAPDTNSVAEMRGYGGNLPELLNADLICFLRNNAALLLEIVEAAESIKRREEIGDYGHEGIPELIEALRKWNGGE